MLTNYESRLSEYFSIPNPGLRAYFGRVRSGQPSEYRTLFYPHKSPTQIVQDWVPQLERSISKEWPSLMQFEIDLAKKVGPLSIMKPLAERMDDIEAYYSGVSQAGEPISESALKAVLSEYGAVRPLRIRSIDRTVEQMKKSTNSGSPYFRKRRTVIDQTVPYTIINNSPNYVQVLPGGTYLCCAVLGWRGQEGGPNAEDVKQRVVWMFPFAVNAAELQLYQPLIEACQRANLVPAWVSMDAVDKEITLLFDTKGKSDLILCTDFTKFDQHFGQSCQDAAHYLLSNIFASNPDTINWLHDVFPIKYNIPLMYDYGELRFGAHGMGSGSGGTNADETLVHRALQYEAAIRAGSRLNPHSQCLGDDGILSYPGLTVDDVIGSYSCHGLEMNPDKQSSSPHECIYLRRWHHTDYRVDGICVGVYSTCRALGKLAEQERLFSKEVWNEKLEALRQLSILENVKYHPLKEQFVEYVLKGTKYKLGLEIPGFFRNLEKEYREIEAKGLDVLGYVRSEMSNKTSINDWWIVQHLKSNYNAL